MRTDDVAVHRNPTVLGVGFASFFSDVGHEMATAALPSFLSTLGAPAAALGAIEGLADASLSASKLAGGFLADRPGASRKGIAATGYLVTGLGYGSFALATTWPAVALGRAVAWAARGIRSPARDALLADAVPATHLGRAFGVERAGDSIGAIVGPLIAAALIGVVSYRSLFALSMIPAIFAALAVTLLTKEKQHRHELTEHLGRLRDLVRTPGRFRSLVAGVGLYGLGNFSSTLLILRATQVLHANGRSSAAAASVAILLYTAHNASNAFAAYPAGALADRLGRRNVLVVGIGLFGLACLAFVFGPTRVPALGVLFVAIGASTAMVETAEGSHASELLPPSIRGRGFGLLGLVDGIGDLVSSLVIGVIWTVTAPAWGFAFAALMSFLGCAVLLSLDRAGDASGGS
ncbi:MAG: MFS transporter [Actinomycetota bacterium]